MNRVLQYVTDAEKLRGYEECVLTDIAWFTGRMIDENEAFHDICAYFSQKRIRPEVCAQEILTTLGWISQVPSDGHGHEENNS